VLDVVVCCLHHWQIGPYDVNGMFHLGCSAHVYFCVLYSWLTSTWIETLPRWCTLLVPSYIIVRVRWILQWLQWGFLYIYWMTRWLIRFLSSSLGTGGLCYTSSDPRGLFVFFMFCRGCMFWVTVAHV
jgi:hypothetical protein